MSYLACLQALLVMAIHTMDVGIVLRKDFLHHQERLGLVLYQTLGTLEVSIQTKVVYVGEDQHQSVHSLSGR